MSQVFQSRVDLSLTVFDPSEAINFYSRAFNANERYRIPLPDGTVVHAEFEIGETGIMISGEYPEWSALAIPEGQSASTLFCIQVEKCETAFEQALSAGAKKIDGPNNQPWGWRTAVVEDPYGYRWNLREKLEDLTPEDMMLRLKKLLEG